ncbi:MAG: Ni/Fe-hydrogenase subunit HybB-like protein [Bacteroidia bacterium]|jgi:Ni/Fe-hydrogenase subunit HybB-like protein|nr:polysulfide reductase NrfD [Bacteroidia bacterium]HAV26097.1 hydrogenase [Bacteroidota bacterium]|tara:strand:+ start:9657 stop:11003 length:1347 start_codon:yes stop_codon:yes gene_type:complete
MYSADIRQPLVTGGKTYSDVTADICRPIENKPTSSWWMGFSLGVLFLLVLVGTLTWTVWEGIGTWNTNKSVMWGWDITNFVFWVGIGHAGTLISAILLLFRQKWRMSINRSAEAMTIFAVFCAAIFPLFHMGRVWLGFWPLPLPNAFGSLWVNFNSPLLWDVFAISTYLSVSLVFWYLGLIPDIATVRDRATSKARKFWYGFFAMGWNGSAKSWGRYEVVALILAGISTPLVLSVHTIVSMDFATSVIPGWHTTIFPPYFVAGAIFSGFGMVLTLLLIARHVMNYQDYITTEHLEAMTKVILLTGSIVGVAYITEFVIAAYSGYEYEQYAFANRMFGPYAWAYWTMMFCNLMAPQVFWSKWARTTPWFIFVVSIIVNIGMWFERFVIIVTSLHRDFLPSSWVMYHATWVEVGIFLGTFGLFFTCFFLFAKFLPVINMSEIKTIIKDKE